MSFYERKILEKLPGSPREKYEYLLMLEKDNINLYAKVEQAKTFCRGLLSTPGLEDIHSIVRANYENLTKA